MKSNEKRTITVIMPPINNSERGIDTQSKPPAITNIPTNKAFISNDGGYNFLPFNIITTSF